MHTACFTFHPSVQCERNAAPASLNSIPTFISSLRRKGRFTHFLTITQLSRKYLGRGQQSILKKNAATFPYFVLFIFFLSPGILHRHMRHFLFLF